MIPAALHVKSRQIQPYPHDLLKQSLPDLIHHNLVLAIQFGRSSHEASENGVNATSGQETKVKGKVGYLATRVHRESGLVQVES